MSRVIYIAFALVVAALGLALQVRNDGPVVVDFYATSITTDLSIVIVAAIVLGALLGMLAMTWTVLKLRRENRALTRKNENATREISGLRSIALKDAG